jgi:hypothetical protein
MKNPDLVAWLSVVGIVLISIFSVRFSLSRPMLQGILKWVFAITVFPLFIVGMILNLSFVETQLPALFGLFEKAKGMGKSESLIGFIIAVPLPVLICFVWYAILLWTAELMGKPNGKAHSLTDIALTSGTTDYKMPARVVIFRKDFVGHNYTEYILLDGKQIVEIGYREFVSVEVAGGKHTTGIRRLGGSQIKKYRDREFDIELN